MVGLSPNCEIWGGGGVFFVPMKIKAFRKKNMCPLEMYTPANLWKCGGGAIAFPAPPPATPVFLNKEKGKTKKK